MTDYTQFDALLFDTRAILARNNLEQTSDQRRIIRFACAFPLPQTVQALAWLNAQPKPFDEDWLLQPLTGRTADIVLTRRMPADAVQIARIEHMLHQAAALFRGQSPGWEIGPIEVPDNPSVIGVPTEAISVDVFDIDPAFAGLMEQNIGQLATLNLSARRLNEIRISSRFTLADAARAARAAFKARYAIPKNIRFSVETLRYSSDDIRISLNVVLESRRPDPVLITRYQLMLHHAALAFGGSPPDWIHDDWRKR